MNTGTGGDGCPDSVESAQGETTSGRVVARTELARDQVDGHSRSDECGSLVIPDGDAEHLFPRHDHFNAIESHANQECEIRPIYFATRFKSVSYTITFPSFSNSALISFASPTTQIATFSMLMYCCASCCAMEGVTDSMRFA